MSTPAVSVVIPVYNTAEKLLRRCVDSVLAQTLQDYEVIVVDDGSCAEVRDSIDAICEVDARVRVFHIENRGVAAARNLGTERAQGRSIIYIDADDYIAPWALEDLWKVLARHEDVDAVRGYTIIPDEGPSFSRAGTHEQPVSLGDMRRNSLVGFMTRDKGRPFLCPGVQAFLVRVDLARQTPFPIGLSYMEDTVWDLMLLNASKGVMLCPEPVYAYVVNPASATHTYFASSVEHRVRALHQLDSLVPEGQREWLALRCLATYFACCKALIWDSENGSLVSRVRGAMALRKSSVWAPLFESGVAARWPRKERIKRFLVITGLAPLLIAIKGER